MSIAHLAYLKRVSHTLATSASKAEIVPVVSLQPHLVNHQAWPQPPGNNLGDTNSQAAPLLSSLFSLLSSLLRRLRNFWRNLVHPPTGNNQRQQPVSDVDAAYAVLEKADAAFHAAHKAPMSDADAAKAVFDKAEAVLDAAQKAFDALPSGKWKLGEPHTDLARKQKEDAHVTNIKARDAIHAAKREVIKARNRWSELIHREVMNTSNVPTF